MAWYLSRDDIVTDFTYLCETISGSQLCEICKAALLQRYVDDTPASVWPQRVKAPNLRTWAADACGQGTKAYVMWEEYAGKDPSVAYLKLRLSWVLRHAFLDPTWRDRRYKEWIAEFSAPVTFGPIIPPQSKGLKSTLGAAMRTTKKLFRPRVGGPVIEDDAFAVPEWEAKMWFACMGKYTLQDLGRGRDIAEFARGHIARLQTCRRPEFEECECPNRDVGLRTLGHDEGETPPGVLRFAEVVGDSEVDRVSVVLSHMDEFIVEALRLAYTRMHPEKSKTPSEMFGNLLLAKPKTIEELEQFWATDELQNDLTGLQPDIDTVIAKDSDVAFQRVNHWQAVHTLLTGTKWGDAFKYQLPYSAS